MDNKLTFEEILDITSECAVEILKPMVQGTLYESQLEMVRTMLSIIMPGSQRYVVLRLVEAYALEIGVDPKEAIRKYLLSDGERGKLQSIFTKQIANSAGR